MRQLTALPLKGGHVARVDEDRHRELRRVGRAAVAQLRTQLGEPGGGDNQVTCAASAGLDAHALCSLLDFDCLTAWLLGCLAAWLLTADC